MRYHSSGEILHTLKSVERYASWVRHIYVVVWKKTQVKGHLEEYMEARKDRIIRVKHKEIGILFDTFNSMGIESRLYKIPRLSDIFIYLNDDTFFTRPVVPDDFVKMRRQGNEWKAILQILETDKDTRYIAEANDLNFNQAMKNTNELMN